MSATDKDSSVPTSSGHISKLPFPAFNISSGIFLLLQQASRAHWTRQQQQQNTHTNLDTMEKKKRKKEKERKITPKQQASRFLNSSAYSFTAT